MNVKHPYQFNGRGRTAESNNAEHIEEMIRQILFTNPGERVNRPNFGCGLLQAVFEPNSSEMAATIQYLAQSSLNQWMSHLIEVNNLEINSVDSSLEVTVVYTILKTKESQTAVFRS